MPPPPPYISTLSLHDALPISEMHPMLHESHAAQRRTVEVRVHRDIDSLADEQELEHGDVPAELSAPERPPGKDRKSTRLNSSHQIISYAVFCLKKKTPNSKPR